MKLKLLAGMVGLTLFCALPLLLGASSCADDDACTNGEYRCSGTVLERCTDGSFANVEDCAGKGMCMASMGHCHPGGMGGMGGMGGGFGVSGGVGVGPTTSTKGGIGGGMMY